jgi:aminopeptidase YwaD
VAGQVALIERGEITFAEKVSNVVAAGATAAIIFNNVPGGFTGSLRSATAIPVVALAREEGLSLREPLKDGPVYVEVVVDADVVAGESRNVVGVRRGPRPGAVVIGGHFDSIPISPGANDNASGTAVMLELARYFGQRDYPYTLYFVAFGAEEIGLRGSQRFAQELPDDARRELRAMLNLDMVGVGDALRLGGSSELIDVALGIAEARGVAASGGSGGRGGGSSDHESFQRAGVPALFLHFTSDPNYHSPRDRAEFLDSGNLALVGDLAIQLLERLAMESPQ